MERISGFREELWGLCVRGDKVIVTADHGCDPAFHGTDHTREYVPLLVMEKGRIGEAVNVGKMDSFSECIKQI